MDANRTDIFHHHRTEFHIDRYLFAAKYITDKAVLDVASGLGYGADCMYKNASPSIICGVEFDIFAVAYANKKYANKFVNFTQGSITNIPFEDNSFDIVTSFETIEHIEDEDKQLQEIKRVLKNNGLYILSTPNNWGLTKHHVKDYDYFSIKELINRYFTIEEIYNQNSESNRIMQRQIELTTMDNYN